MRRPGLTTALALTLGAAMPLKAGAEDKIKPRDLVGKTVVVEDQSTDVTARVQNVRGQMFELDGQTMDASQDNGDVVYRVGRNGNFPVVHEFPAATIASARMVDNRLRVYFTVSNPDEEAVCVEASVDSFDAERGLVVANDSFDRVEQDRACADSDTVLPLVKESTIREPNLGDVVKGEAMLACEAHDKDVSLVNIKEFETQAGVAAKAAKATKYRAAAAAFDKILALEGVCIPPEEANVGLDAYADSGQSTKKFRLLLRVIDSHPKGDKTIRFIQKNFQAGTPEWEIFLEALKAGDAQLQLERDDKQKLVDCYEDTSKCEELGIDTYSFSEEELLQKATGIRVEIEQIDAVAKLMKKVPQELRTYLFHLFNMQREFVLLNTNDPELRALLDEAESKYSISPFPLDPKLRGQVEVTDAVLHSSSPSKNVLVLSPESGVDAHRIGEQELPLECDDFAIGEMRECDVLEPGAAPVVADAGTEEVEAPDEAKEKEPREPRQPREREEREPRKKKEREAATALARKDAVGFTSSVEAGVVVDELHAEEELRPGATATERVTAGVDLPGGRTVSAVATFEHGSEYDPTDISTAYTARPAHVGSWGVRACQRLGESSAFPVNPVGCVGVTAIQQPHLGLSVGVDAFVGADLRLVNDEKTAVHLRAGGGAGSRVVQAGNVNATLGVVLER